MAASFFLQLEPRCTVVRGEHGQQPALVSLPIGWEDLAEAFHLPVSAGDIELAIERVEDAIGHRRVGFTGVLEVHGDQTMQAIAGAAGMAGKGNVCLTIQAVEGLFTRLTKQAIGSLPRADQVPEEPRFAATLVIVRELMHHLPVQALDLRT